MRHDDAEDMGFGIYQQHREEQALEELLYSPKSTTPPAAQPAVPLTVGVGGGLVAIKTLLSRDPCAHAALAIEMIDAMLNAASSTHVPREPIKPVIDPGFNSMQRIYFKYGWKSAEEAHGIKDQP